MGTELTECNNNLRMQLYMFIVGYFPSCLRVLASGNILPYQSILLMSTGKHKKYYPTVSGTCFLLLSVLHLHLLILVPYCATQGAPFARIREHIVGKQNLIPTRGFPGMCTVHYFWDNPRIIIIIILNTVPFLIFGSQAGSWKTPHAVYQFPCIPSSSILFLTVPILLALIWRIPTFFQTIKF